jgi:hypothetical protein
VVISTFTIVYCPTHIYRKVLLTIRLSLLIISQLSPVIFTNYIRDKLWPTVPREVTNLITHHYLLFEYSKDFFVNLISFGVVNTFVGFVSNEACASGKKKTCCVLRSGPTKTMTEIVSHLNYSETTAKMPNIYIYTCLFGCCLRTPCRKRASSFDGFHLATLIQKGIYIYIIGVL